MLQLGKNSFVEGIFDLVAKRQVKQLILEFVKMTRDAVRKKLLCG